MLNTEDVDDPVLIIDLVDDPIGAASCRPESGELALKWVSDPARVLHQRPEQELHHRRSDPFRESCELSFG